MVPIRMRINVTVNNSMINKNLMECCNFFLEVFQ